jgi:SpoIID/LytB domain protein
MWVGETSERQHIEKLKAMSLLAKGYMLYYLNGENQHPNIPDDASYNWVDDPRIFQKYVWAGRESHSPKWMEALEQTVDEVILYNWYLPILPYFHCSAGFTWSAMERFGWKDTPYLKWVIDFATCESWLFEWHGVGLSGDGSEVLAQKGVSYKNILKYYYDGIRIASFD